VSKKQKFYVVWQGVMPGVYNDWKKAEAQIKAFPDAKFKAFESESEANKAFTENPWKHLGKPATKPVGNTKMSALVGKPLADSISVDAACKGNPGVLEYQGVETATKRILFSMGPFPEGTVNIGEFLAIVHGLAFLQKHESSIPIYSDSKTALSWVKNKAIKTNLARNKKNAELFELVDRAVLWLKNNQYSNKIIKWETEFWGENPADYGRK
jgi:ribonuclease HI